MRRGPVMTILMSPVMFLPWFFLVAGVVAILVRECMDNCGSMG
jgi:hypothetical protein